MFKSFLMAAPLLVILFQPHVLRAQDASASKVLEYLPEHTIAVVSLWPAQLAASPAMRLAPLEVLTAAGMENFGMDPLRIERADVLLGLAGPLGPQFGVLLQSTQPLDIESLNPEMLDGNGVIDENGFEYVGLRLRVFPEEIVIHLVDANTAVVGTKAFAKLMTTSDDADGELAAILRAIKTEQDGLAIVSVNALRPLLQGFAQGAPPPVANDLETIVDATEFVALRVLVGSEDKLQLVISATDAAAAEEVEASLQRSLNFIHQQIVDQTKSEIPLDSATGQAMHDYIDRLGAEILAVLQPKRTGNRLIIELEDLRSMGVAGTLTGLLLPAVQSARWAARRMQSSNNLKQMGLALHNFHDAYGTFPATAGLDDDGEPMISWRVAILPFIEEQDLYNQFRLDEPWDSEHNIALLEQMPELFKHPSRPTEAGHTVYQAPINDQTLLRLKEPSGFRDITDGTSNTIMLVETVAERAVPWTAPQDYELDMEDPAAGLFDGQVGQFLFGDGSVRPIPAAVDLEMLRAMFTRSGGEVVDVP